MIHAQLLLSLIIKKSVQVGCMASIIKQNKKLYINRPYHGFGQRVRNYSVYLYWNVMSNNFPKTAVLKKKMNCKLKRHS